ncbi:hypothetical protein B0H11DRAFT_59893 [Mycena galericulata]|nr:hypothetical protein B0H11DRAFT_59893 [Mycena galericulata]
MHPSLHIPEIVSMICDELLNGAERLTHSLNPDTSQSLAAMARTCKTFRDPALDLLWSSQDTVMNVLDCMPGDIWEWLDELEPEEIRLKRPVLPGDWERPLVYSRRVKFFKFDESHSYPLCTAFYETLRMCLPPDRLFPNIEFVEWDTSELDAALFPHFRLFVGPRLTSLSLGECQSTGHLSCLPSLATECPLLQDLIIKCSKGLNGRCQIVSFLVKQLTHLRNLDVPCLDAAALKHLARLPGFDYLTLSDQSPLDSLSTLPAQSGVLSSGLEELETAFSGLEGLDMDVTDVRAVSDVLIPLRQSSLVRLKLQFPRSTPANAVAGYYLAVAVNCDHDSLRFLSITLEDPPKDAPDPSQMALDPVPGQKLLPLFVFSNLTHVNLSAPIGFHLDDTTAAEVASAWPRLISLTLAASASIHIPSRMTLRALLSFAKSCPSLFNLELQLHAAVVPKWEAQKPDEERPRQRSLRYLDVMDSPVGPPLDVAAFLSSVFPRLRGLSTGHERRRGVKNPPPEPAHVLEQHQKWKTAEAALPVMGRVRAEEQYWTERQHAGN